MAKNLKARLDLILAGCEEVTSAKFSELLVETGSNATYLRRVLRKSSIPLHPLVEGVQQDSRANLIRTLGALANLYPEHPKEIRSVVLEAKNHTRFALGRYPNDLWRSEVWLHLNTWLENPSIYPLWAALRIE